MNKFFNILRDTCYICLQELKNVFRDQGVLIFLVVGMNLLAIILRDRLQNKNKQ